MDKKRNKIPFKTCRFDAMLRFLLSKEETIGPNVTVSIYSGKEMEIFVENFKRKKSLQS